VEGACRAILNNKLAMMDIERSKAISSAILRQKVKLECITYMISMRRTFPGLKNRNRSKNTTNLLVTKN
jgi:hypothetical protein